MPQQEPSIGPIGAAKWVRAIRRNHALQSTWGKNEAAEFAELESRVLEEEKAAIDKLRADPSENAAFHVEAWEAAQMVAAGEAMIAEGRRNFQLLEEKHGRSAMYQQLDGVGAGLAGNSGRSPGPEVAPRVAPRPINPFIGGGG